MTLTSLFKTIFRLLLRTVLVLMGLVFALSLLAAALLLFAAWGLRALWARLTGRPVRPLAITILRRRQWQGFYRPQGGATAPAADVIDVEARAVDAGPGR